MHGLKPLMALALLAIAEPVEAQALNGAPLPPDNAAPNLVLPPHRADGQFVTPSDGVAGMEAVWHMRAALNVAALGCPGEKFVSGYNALLRRHSASFAAANTAVSLRYRASAGAGAEAARDKAMTKLYNFFAQVPGHADFCALAGQVLDEVMSVDSAELPRYATAVIAELQSPFQAFYARYEAYRDSLAAVAAHTPRVTYASVER